MSPLLLQTDFGLKDGAVAAMKGVVFNVDPKLIVHDITHNIPVFDTWAASCRLEQTINYWPEGSVFLSVVDPGVGTERSSVVAKTKDNKYIVTPNNGTLTLVADSVGINELREIDEDAHRLQNSYDSHTFHGRDVYAYVGARLASGIVSFELIGPIFEKGVEKLRYQRAEIQNQILSGNIPILDVQFGNVWTNIPIKLTREFDLQKGNFYLVRIFNKDTEVYKEAVPFVNSFGDVDFGKPLLYLNSILNLSLALNLKSFVSTYKIASGSRWKITVEKH